MNNSNNNAYMMQPNYVPQYNPRNIDAAYRSDIRIHEKKCINELDLEKIKAWAVIKEEISNVRYAITEFEGLLYYSALYNPDERNADGYRQTSGIHMVCSAKDLLLIRIKTDNENEVKNIISFDGKYVFLRELSVSCMRKELEKAGVNFYVPRRKKPDVLNALLMWLIDNAQDEYMPKYIGWNKDKDGKWYWANAEAHVLERMNL